MPSVMAVSAIVPPVSSSAKPRLVRREDQSQQSFSCPRCSDKDQDYVGTWFYSLSDLKCQGCDHRFSCATINRSGTSK